MNTNETPPASCVRARGRDNMGYGYVNTCTGESLRSRACAREDFYAPAIRRDLDEAVDFALAETGGDPKYRGVLCFYCFHLGINTFMDQLFSVMSCCRQGELRRPAPAFHARLKKLMKQIHGEKGGAK